MGILFMSNINLSKKEVIHLSHLSQLKLSDAEVEKYQKQLSETFDYVNNLNEVVKKKNEVQSEKYTENVFFEDVASDARTLTQDQALSNAQKQKNHYFLVDKIL